MADVFKHIPINQESKDVSYELLQIIGKGAFSKVVLGRHILTGMDVAVKIIDSRDFHKVHRNIKRDLRCREDLHHHPNIIKLYHVISNSKYLFLITELAPGGDMLEYLYAHGRLAEDVARSISRQLVSALHYCHTKGITHRDLKPQHVLLNYHMDAKLTGFGSGTPFMGNELKIFCGSSGAAPPELFQRQMYHGPAMDIWGLGVLLYKMLTNTLPFRGETPEELKQNVLKGQYTLPPYLSLKAINLLQKLITLNPQDRQSLQTIMPDPWLNEGYEEELKPYTKPQDVIDLWVTREMLHLGFQWHDIHDTVSNKRNNHLMATYSILKERKAELQRHPVQREPFYRTPGLQSHSPSPAAEARTTTTPGMQGSRPATPEPIPDLRPTTPAPILDSMTTFTEPSQGSQSTTTGYRRGSRTTTSELSLGFRIPSPVHTKHYRIVPLQFNPRFRIIIPESSSESTITALEYTPESSTTSIHAPTGCPGDSPSTGQGCQRVARRCWNFLRFCCMPPKKGHGRCNEVHRR